MNAVNTSEKQCDGGKQNNDEVNGKWGREGRGVERRHSCRKETARESWQ